MPNRTIYVKDAKLWYDAVQFAYHKRISMSELIEQAIRAYLEELSK